MTTAVPDPGRPVEVRVVADVGQYVSAMRRAAERAFREVAREDEADRCGACDHAHENHDRVHDGGPCSLCDCRGFQNA